jgi:hypothetical protein
VDRNEAENAARRRAWHAWVKRRFAELPPGNAPEFTVGELLQAFVAGWEACQELWIDAFTQASKGDRE